MRPDGDTVKTAIADFEKAVPEAYVMREGEHYVIGRLVRGSSVEFWIPALDAKHVLDALKIHPLPNSFAFVTRDSRAIEIPCFAQPEGNKRKALGAIVFQGDYFIVSLGPVSRSVGYMLAYVRIRFREDQQLDYDAMVTPPFLRSAFDYHVVRLSNTLKEDISAQSHRGWRVGSIQVTPEENDVLIPREHALTLALVAQLLCACTIHAATGMLIGSIPTGLGAGFYLCPGADYPIKVSNFIWREHNPEYLKLFSYALSQMAIDFRFLLMFRILERMGKRNWPGKSCLKSVIRRRLDPTFAELVFLRFIPAMQLFTEFESIPVPAVGTLFSQGSEDANAEELAEGMNKIRNAIAHADKRDKGLFSPTLTDFTALHQWCTILETILVYTLLFEEKPLK